MGYSTKMARPPRRKPTDRSISVEPDTSKPQDNQSASAPKDLPTPRQGKSGDHEYSFSVDQDKSCGNCETLEKTLKKERNVNLQLKIALEKEKNKHRSGMFCEHFVASDAKVRMNTGLPNRQASDALYKHVEKNVGSMHYWVGQKKVVSTGFRRYRRTPKKFGPQRKLSAMDEMVLVLMKLRQGVKNNLLCSIFDISLSSCSQIVNTWIRFLAKELKPLIFWPDKVTVSTHLPPELSLKYPNLRCTLDCTEIFIERPRHLEIQSLTWSDYKKHNTVKYLIAIAPNGMISFLSHGWGGRTSDKHIVNESGFLHLLDPGDVVLADRGFTIMSELLMRGARLEIPPPGSGCEQQIASDVAKTKKIANARIHVERAIGRLKWFAILQHTVPITLVPLLDDVITVCAALCNLLPPPVGK